MIWVFKLCLLFHMFLFKSIYNQRTTFNCYFTSTTKDWFITQSERAKPRPRPTIGWLTYALSVHYHVRHDVIIVDIESFSAPLTSQWLSPLYQHPQVQVGHNTVRIIQLLLPSYYQYSFWICNPDFWLFHFDPPELKWHTVSLQRRHTYVRRELIWTCLSLVPSLGIQPETLWGSECLYTCF